MCGLGNTCPPGESPAWWDGADAVDRMANDPRWGGMLETFGNLQQSMPAGYAMVFDRQANQLAVTLRTTAEDAAAVSDFVYFGIAGHSGGGYTAGSSSNTLSTNGVASLLLLADFTVLVTRPMTSGLIM